MERFKIRHIKQKTWLLEPGAGTTDDESEAYVYDEESIKKAFPTNTEGELARLSLIKQKVDEEIYYTHTIPNLRGLETTGVDKGIYPGWIPTTTEPLIQPNTDKVDFNGMFNPTKEDKAYDTTFPSSMDDVTNEKPKFKETLDSINSLLEYKNKKYGNAALEPLKIFQGKCKVGQRLDDKLARVKNSDSLKKNDIADLIGYLTLVCVENGWNNFDEFKD